jgi:hypothetical protein
MRIKDRNAIGWYNYFGTFPVSAHYSIHTEYQWRRDEIIKNPMQSLLRLGLNYQLNAKIQWRLGYAWIETYDYGDYPINAFGKRFTEHRIYEMLTLQDQSGKFDFSHRFMLEQRWIGQYSDIQQTREDSYAFANRARYMFRTQYTPGRKPGKSRGPYLAVYDEVMIGFGENVRENVFDQNRLGILLGYVFQPGFRVEAGYLNQILQLGREVNGMNVFQYNNGVIANVVINTRPRKKNP